MVERSFPAYETSAPDRGEAVWDTIRSVLQAQRAALPLQPVPRDGLPHASFGQQRLWFLERLIPGSAIHNYTTAYALIGPLILPALEQALGEIVTRHEALRTTLRWSGNTLVQDIHPPSVFVIRVEDLRASAGSHVAERLEAGTRQEASAPFNIDQPPLLRAKLFRLTDDEHRLVLTMHELVFDGWSFDVFMRELCALYTAFVANKPSPLPQLAVQYADWSVWQRGRLQGQAVQRLLAYWQEQMRGPLPELRMPTDHPRRAVQSRRGGWRAFHVPPSLTQSLQRMAKQEGATCYMVLLTAFQVLLRRYTGEEDIVVGSPVANRYHAEVERLIGFFVNTLPMRARVSGAESFRNLLAQVRRTVLGAYEHQDLPFEMLVQTVGASSRSGAAPLFRVVFAFQNLPHSTWLLPDLSIEARHVPNGTAIFDITLSMWDAPAGFDGLLEYDADLFDEATVSQWLKHFKALLEAIVRDPDAPVASLLLLDDTERTELLQSWNATIVPYPRHLPIHRVFEQRVREFPEAIALASDDGTVTYSLLERNSNRLARHLKRHGVARGKLVGVCLQRSPSFVVTLLAILKSGGAFVPIDPSWPEERIGVGLACAPLVVTEDLLATRLQFLSARLVSIDGDSHAIERESAKELDVEVSAEDLAYVMYTSGSTGLPKGVCVPHRGVVRLVRGANYAEFSRADVFLQLAPVAFDASTFEIWGALLNGATLAIPSARQLSLSSIGQVLRQFGVTILWLTTGLFQAMVDKRVADLRTVRQLFVGGDVLSSGHAERCLRQAPGCRLVNCYGPTENTTFTTFHPVGLSSCDPGGSIPIGRPVSNTQVYVLDKLLQPVPLGVAGDAYVGGDGLMRGYLVTPASTHVGLVPSPFPTSTGEFLYRTGDIVRWRRDGVLEFLGREDDQVKIRGFRAEPGEAEAVLNRCPAVQSIAVIATDDAIQGKRLRAFSVPASSRRDRDDVIREIRDFARRCLPDYLVPSEFIVVDAIPLDANGKVDRQRLRGTTHVRSARADLVTLRNTYEQAIAQMFEQVLCVSPIGADSDFFESGGSSLSALHLLMLLEDAFAIDLPLASLYEHPTPAELAVLIPQLQLERSSKDAQPEARSLLVEIKRGGATPPLFVLAGGTGGMEELTRLGKVLSHVRCDYPVYGFIAKGVDGRAPAHASVEATAEAYLAEMRQRQKHGPYALGGECVGGLIAFEMAQQLIAQGEKIALLLLLDTWCPTVAGGLRHRYVEPLQSLVAARCAIARDGLADVAGVLRDLVRDRPPLGPLRSLRYTINATYTLLRVAQPWIAAVLNYQVFVKWTKARFATRLSVARLGIADMSRALRDHVRNRPPFEPLHSMRYALRVTRTLLRITHLWVKQVGKRPEGKWTATIDYYMRYRPRRYPGPVTLIVCENSRQQGLVKPWRSLASKGLVVRSVPGDHNSYLHGRPRSTASVIEDCLNESLGAGAAPRPPRCQRSTHECQD